MHFLPMFVIVAGKAVPLSEMDYVNVIAIKRSTLFSLAIDKHVPLKVLQVSNDIAHGLIKN